MREDKPEIKILNEENKCCAQLLNEYNEDMSKTEVTITENAKAAFDNYLMWLRWYPCDYKGATAQAGDFIDNIEDMDGLEALIRKAAGK